MNKPYTITQHWADRTGADLDRMLHDLYREVTQLRAALGVTGGTGSQGTPGINVLDALDGADGLDGFPGIPGAIGAPGVQGLQGLPGAFALDGTDGLDGIDGISAQVGTLPVARGGTGISAFATGDLLYASSASALSRLTAVALGSALISQNLGAAPVWGQPFYYTTSSSTGAINNYNPGTTGCVFVTLTGAAPALTGIVAGAVGAIVILKNTGTGVATFAHNSGASSAGNKLFNIITSAPTPLGVGGTIAYQYDGTQWQLIFHVQGAAIAYTPTDASGAGLAFSVAAASYIVSGQFVKIDCQVNYPVTASAAAAVIGSLPFTCGGVSGALSVGYLASATSFTALALVNANTTTVSLTTNQSPAITNAQMSNGGIIFSGTYTTN